MINNPIRIVIADDHAVLRVGLKSFLEEQDGRYVVVGEAASGEETLALVGRLHPCLVLLDLSMKGMGGLETTLELRRRGSTARVLVLTQYGEAVYVRRLLEAGANGYLVKSTGGDELLTAIAAVLRGGTYIDPSLAGALFAVPHDDGAARPDDEAFARLTVREQQVLKLVAEGYSNKEMAKALGLAIKTVMTHRANMMERLGIHNRSRLVQFAIRVGLIPIDPHV